MRVGVAIISYTTTRLGGSFNMEMEESCRSEEQVRYNFRIIPGQLVKCQAIKHYLKKMHNTLNFYMYYSNIQT